MCRRAPLPRASPERVGNADVPTRTQTPLRIKDTEAAGVRHELEEIARYVNADRFINRIPDRFAAEVKERGVALSQGEKQLLAFARALAYNPRVLILDEATSSVDSETEALIQDALARLMTKRTFIVIAHRLSTIERINSIIVLHKGRIVERGTHRELLEKKGYYHDLYRIQFKQSS